MVPFLTVKKLFKVEIFSSNLKNSSDIKKMSPKYKNSANICEKNVFYGLLFVLSRRFGDSYWGAVDSVIRKTPG